MTEHNEGPLSADNYYSVVPQWVTYSKISPVAKVVFAVLQRHANPEGSCFPSRKRIANLVGVSLKTIDRAIAELIDIGALIKHRRYGDDGSYRSNGYQVITQAPPRDKEGNFVKPTAPLATSVTLPIVTDDHSPSDKNDSLTKAITNQNQVTKEITCSTEVERHNSDPVFGEFWKAYPRRVGKKAAYDVWLRIIKRTEPREIIEGAKRYAKQEAGNNPKYIAHAKSWLNAERWTDEPDQQFKPKGNRRDEFNEMFEEAARDLFGTDSLGYERKELGS